MISDLSRVNRRMHNKSITADNQMTIVGGRNIGDAYFEANTEMNYADLDALAIGAAVPAVSAIRSLLEQPDRLSACGESLGVVTAQPTECRNR